MVLKLSFGGTMDHQGSVWRQLGSPGIIMDALCDEMTFREIPKSWTIHFPSVSHDNFRKHRRNRCGIDARSFSNHPFISKTMKNMKKLQIYSPSGSYVRVSIILTESGSCYSALRIQRITHDSVLTTLLTIHTDTTHDVFSTHSLLASIARISQLAVLPALTTHCSLLTSPCSLLSAHFSSLPLIAHSYR